MEKEEIQALLTKYAEGNCNDAEKAFLETWYLQENKNFSEELTEVEIAQDIEEIYGLLPQRERNKRPLWLYIAASAAIFNFLCVDGPVEWHSKSDGTESWD